MRLVGLKQVGTSDGRPIYFFPRGRMKITVAGHVCLDTLCTAPPGINIHESTSSFMKPEDLIMSSYLARHGMTMDDVIKQIPEQIWRERAISKGGPAGSAAQAIHQFDPKTQVNFVGCRGNDDNGVWLEKHFQKHRMSTRRLMEIPGEPTGYTLAREQQRKIGEPLRNFILEIGANNALTKDSFIQADFQGAGAFHVGGNFLVPNLDLVKIFTRAARIRSLQTSLDTVFDPLSLDPDCPPGKSWFLPDLKEVLDILTMDLEEAQGISKFIAPHEEMPDETRADAILYHFYRLGYGSVVIKMGALGSKGYVKQSDSRDVFCFMPISDIAKNFPPEEKFPTGAGDIYSGVLVDCLARGLNLPISMALATAAAGFKLKHRGGELGQPGDYFEKVLKYYHALIKQENVIQSAGILPEFAVEE